MDNYVPFSDPWLLCWLGYGDGEVGASGGWCSVIIASLLVANYPLPWPRLSTADNHCSAAAHLHNPSPALLPPKYTAASIIGSLLVSKSLPAV